jgi:hypothetical protein
MGQHWRCARTRGRGGGCEVFRAPPSFGRQLEARQRAGRRAASESTVVRWSTHHSPRAPVSLTRRLRRAVAVWPEEPGLTPLRPPFFGDVTFFYTRSLRRLARRRLARRRHARCCHARCRLRLACAAPPAPSLRCAACAALPLPRRLRRDALDRAAVRGSASPGSAPQRTPRRLAREAVSPPRAAL